VGCGEVRVAPGEAKKAWSMGEKNALFFGEK
jgi:hypothetical protein